MQATRTIVLNLPENDALRETLSAFAEGMNMVSEVAFKEAKRSRFALHKLCYESVREATSLTSQMTCSVMRQVAATYKTAKSNKHKLESPPTFRATSVTLEGGVRGREFKLLTDKGIVSISTVQGRLKLPYTCGDFQDEYLQGDWFPQFAKLVLAKRKGKERLELHVTLTKEVEPAKERRGGVLGVDTGRTVLATATTGQDAVFIPARHLKPMKEHYRRLRKRLQSKGTRSAKKRQRKLAGREHRFTKDFQHVTAKRLVGAAQTSACGVIAVEDLTGIRKRTGAKGKKANYHHGTWAYAQFLEILTCKAEGAGIEVVKVDPSYTSQACSNCGYTDKKNRDGLNFKCSDCGYRLHADLNAARNIRLRAILDGQEPVENGGESTLPDIRLNDDGIAGAMSEPSLSSRTSHLL